MASFFKKGQFSDKTINWFPKVTKSSTNSLRADWTKRAVVSWQMVSKLPRDNGVLWNVFCYLAKIGLQQLWWKDVGWKSSPLWRLGFYINTDSFIIWFFFLSDFQSAGPSQETSRCNPSVLFWMKAAFSFLISILQSQSEPSQAALGHGVPLTAHPTAFGLG